jgi:hypothetical protein
VPDPPDGEAVNVAVCPLSIVTGETETDRAVLTVTVTAEDVTVTGIEELSFTTISNDQMPVVDRMPVETVGVPPALQANEEPKSL